MESKGKVGRQTRGLGRRMLEDEEGGKDGKAEGDTERRHSLNPEGVG